MIITSFQQQAMCLLQPKMILLFQRREICKSKVRERPHRAANIKKSQSGSQQRPAIPGELDCQSSFHLCALNSNNVLNVKLPVLMWFASCY